MRYITLLFLGLMPVLGMAQCPSCDSAMADVVRSTPAASQWAKSHGAYLDARLSSKDPLDAHAASFRYHLIIGHFERTWEKSQFKAFQQAFQNKKATVKAVRSYLEQHADSADLALFDAFAYSDPAFDFRLEQVTPMGEGRVRVEVSLAGHLPMIPELYLDSTNLGTPDSTSIQSPKRYRGTLTTSGTALVHRFFWYIPTPDATSRLIVDADLNYPDPNRLNNASGIPLELRFNKLEKTSEDIRHYSMSWRPDLWYNGYDGVKAGIRLKGNYGGNQHELDVALFANTGIGQNRDFGELENDFDPVSFWVRYNTDVDWFRSRSNVRGDATYLDGLQRFRTGLRVYTRSGKSHLNLEYKLMYRSGAEDLLYLLYPDDWLVDKINATIRVEWRHASYKSASGKGGLMGQNIVLGLRSSVFGSDYDFATAYGEWKGQYNRGPWGFRTRLFGQYGSGLNWARESRLFLAGASPEDLMDNPITRSIGLIPSDWERYGNDLNHFHHTGGLNLRGYAGYLTFEEREDGSIVPVYAGETGAAVNAEADITRWIPSMRKFDELRSYINFRSYVFADAGIINESAPGEDLTFAEVRADAGIGAKLSVWKWGKYSDLNPFHLRFDVPFWVNRPPAGQDFLDFRWVVGVSLSL